MNEVMIEQKDFDKIISYAQCAYDDYKSEIGGMAVCVEVDGEWFIQEPVILKQEISTGNCVLDKTALAKYYTEYGLKYKDQNYRFLWWHSHHTMEAFWSGTDLKAIDEFKDGDLSFALVVNLKREYVMRISVWQPVEIHKDVTLEIVDTEVAEKVTKEVEELCEKESAKVVGHLTNTNRSGWGYNNGYGYKYGAYNSWKQESLFDKETGETYELEEIIEQMNNKVDDIMTEFTTGGINFTKCKNKLIAMNTRLKEAKMPYKVYVPKKQDDDKLYSIEPFQFIEIRDKKDDDAKIALQTYVMANNGWYGV